MYRGVSNKDIQYLTSSVGNIEAHYGFGPLEKMLVLACSMLACS